MVISLLVVAGTAEAQSPVPGNPLRTVLFAEQFAGGDMGAKINAAVAACPATGTNGCRILIPRGLYEFTTTINLTNTSSITLEGLGGGGMMLAESNATTLSYTAAGVGSAIIAPGVVGLEIAHLNFQYTNRGFTGNLVSLSSVGGVVNTSTAHLHHCRVGGTTVSGAARLIELNTTLNLVIERCMFANARIGIGTTGGSNNVVTIRDSWFQPPLATAIRAWGAAWTISGNVFEGIPGVSVMTMLAVDGELDGVTLSGNLGVDGGGAGTHVDLSGGAVNGAYISANVFSSSAGTGVHLGSSSGVVMAANRFDGMTTAWTGTAPTRTHINANSYGSVATRGGVMVANLGALNITKPGKPEDGEGLVAIAIDEDNAQCLYTLSGAGRTTAEINDPRGVCSPNGGTAGSLNVYWNGGKAQYEVENRRGGSRRIRVNFLTSN